MPTLTAAYASLGLDLQEASNAASTLTAGDVRSKLSDAVDQAHRGTGNYGYYMDHAGDDASGDVIFRAGGQTKRAPYSITAGADGKASMAAIDMDNAENVASRTIYEPLCDEGDHYAAMQEAFVKTKLYIEIPLYERFISKQERDAADDSDFAGKGRSYPILKPEDVTAAASSIGRAGSDNLGPSGIKARIVAIAKRKGWTKYLPKSWQTEATKTTESAPAAQAGAIKLVESCDSPEMAMLLREGFGEGAAAQPYRTKYPIRIITPGVGSTAHYSEAMLKKAAAEGKFGPGTLMYWNHPTAAQEASRPEGNLDDLAAITVGKGVWMDDGPKGKGVYSEAKVMADYAQKVGERAPHIGLSIRAGGTGSGRLVEGKPDLASIDYVESIDYVTKAGRGGLALAEAARNAGLLDPISESEREESSMLDANDLKLLREGLAAQTATTTLLLEKEMRRDAIALGVKLLGGLDLPNAAKERAVESVVERPMPKTADGQLDTAKLTEAFTDAAKREGVYVSQLTNGGRVHGFGPALVAPALSVEESARREAAEKAEDTQYLNVMESLMGDKTAAKFAFQGRGEDAA